LRAFRLCQKRVIDPARCATQVIRSQMRVPQDHLVASPTA